MLVAGTVLLLALAGAQVQTCRLSRVTVMSNITEDRLTGTWYKLRDYNSGGYTRMLGTDAALDIQFVDGGLNVTMFEKRGGVCTKETEKRRKIETGKYSFIERYIKREVQTWVVYTNYQDALVLFLCKDISDSGAICRDPSVSIYKRFAPYGPSRSGKCPFQGADGDWGGFMGSLGVLCIDTSRYLDISHTSATEGCVTDQRCQGPNNCGLCPYDGADDTCGCRAGCCANLALVTAQKEKLAEEKRKLVTEREMLGVMKEKLVTEREMLELKKQKLLLENAVLRGTGAKPNIQA